MIDGLKAYPAMSESGVPWLGEVPKHWEVVRMKAVCRLATGHTPSRKMAEYWANCTVPWFTLGDVHQIRGDRIKYVAHTKERVSELGLANSSAVKLPRGTVILSRTASVGWSAILDCSMATSQDFMAWTPGPRVSSEYLLAVLRAMRPEFARLMYGSTHNTIYMPVLHDFRMPLPPVPEQAAIIRLVDYADRLIQRSIRSKEKLSKLLEEQRQAIIRRAVTRGLDPNVRLKPSGVEWLGEVPEHWDVVPLKFLSKRIQNGATPSTAEVAFYENGVIPWYGPSSCGHGEHVGEPVRHLAQAAFTAGRARLIHQPALLVIVIGATAGRMALLPHDGATNQQITSYELRTKRVFPRFVLHQLRGVEHWLRSTASTATIPILDGGVVSRLLVAIPSVTEQESIVCRADEETAGLSTAIDRARREMELLRELRTRLIADVVTGKLDVREAAARLPDEADGPEPINEIEVESDAEEDDVDGTDDVLGEAEA